MGCGTVLATMNGLVVFLVYVNWMNYSGLGLHSYVWVIVVVVLCIWVVAIIDESWKGALQVHIDGGFR